MVRLVEGCDGEVQIAGDATTTHVACIARLDREWNLEWAGEGEAVYFESKRILCLIV
jgi:hypothetical protein